MFKKVLIAEDYESSSISVRKTLDDLGIYGHDYVYYCDDALTKIKKALQEDQPYDLLITDLFFEADHTKQKLVAGGDLVVAVRKVQPKLKVLVFSAEHNPAIINGLFNELSINGYVRKARHDAQELKLAINTIYRDKLHSPIQDVQKKYIYEFTDFDVTIITQLSKGMLQKDIPAYLEQHAIRPASLSSLEKRLTLIKDKLHFPKTNN